MHSFMWHAHSFVHGCHSDWLIEVLHLWAAVPNCNFWNLQWASLLSRVIKHSSLWEVWEPLLPTLFTFYLRSFEVWLYWGGASQFFEDYPYCLLIYGCIWVYDVRSSCESSIVWGLPVGLLKSFNLDWTCLCNVKSILLVYINLSMCPKSETWCVAE